MEYPLVTEAVFDDDDWLEPPAQGGSADPLVNQEYTRLSNKFSDAGYREGITDGKLSTLQQGFDQGFAQSVPLSRRVGMVRGRAAALLAVITTGPAPKPSHASADLEDTTRTIIRRLGVLRRDEVLAEDQERIEHERDEHPEGEGFELEPTDQRDMEGLEKSLGLMGGKGDGAVEDGEVVLARLEAELQEIEKAVLRR
ncbi:hypothetical protein IAU60_001618 [Kwoniella sp. DSM 27419]